MTALEYLNLSDWQKVINSFTPQKEVAKLMEEYADSKVKEFAKFAYHPNEAESVIEEFNSTQ